MTDLEEPRDVFSGADNHTKPASAPVPLWVERWVRFAENSWSIPGTRFRVGLDPVLGLLLPGAGDWIASLFGLGLVWEAARHQVPLRVLVRMLLLVLVDATLGAVPLVGDAFDLVYRSNTKNLELLRKHAKQPLDVSEAWPRLLAALGILIATGAVLFVITIVGAGLLLAWAIRNLGG